MLPEPEGRLSTVMPSSSIAAANKEVKQVLDKAWKEFEAWSSTREAIRVDLDTKTGRNVVGLVESGSLAR